MKAVVSLEGKTYTRIPTLVQNSYGYDVYFYIKNEDDSAVDLSNIETATLDIKDIDTSTVKTIGLTVSDAANGELTWTVSDTDLADTGVYEAEINLINATTGLAYRVKLGLFLIVEEIS